MDSDHSEKEAGSPVMVGTAESQRSQSDGSASPRSRSPASRSPPPRSPAKKLYQCGEKPYQYNQASYALGGPLGTGTLPFGQFYQLESAKKNPTGEKPYQCGEKPYQHSPPNRTQ